MGDDHLHHTGDNMPRPQSLEEWQNVVMAKFRAGEEEFEKFKNHLIAVDAEVQSIKMQGDENMTLTKSIKADTAGLVEAWTIGKGAGRAGTIIGNFAIWIVKASIAVGIVFAFFKAILGYKLP
jgi:hypothetical protein